MTVVRALLLVMRIQLAGALLGAAVAASHLQGTTTASFSIGN
jgi:hypothetical protein